MCVERWRQSIARVRARDQAERPRGWGDMGCRRWEMGKWEEVGGGAQRSCRAARTHRRKIDWVALLERYSPDLSNEGAYKPMRGLGGEISRRRRWEEEDTACGTQRLRWRAARTQRRGVYAGSKERYGGGLSRDTGMKNLRAFLVELSTQQYRQNRFWGVIHPTTQPSILKHHSKTF